MACSTNKIPYVPSVDPSEAFEVLAGSGISVDKTVSGGKTTYTVGLYKAPTASISNDAGILEVGAVSGTITWTINSANGSTPIQTRTLDPDEGITGTTGVFQFQKSGITLTSAGITSLYTLTVDDQEGSPVVVTSGVNFQFKVFQGYSASPTLDETAIEALVNSQPATGILSVYGGEQTYSVPSANQYIYWVYPTATTGITSAELNGLPFPIEVVGTVSVTNVNAIATNYTVVRSSNKFGIGTLDITLS